MTTNEEIKIQKVVVRRQGGAMKWYEVVEKNTPENVIFPRVRAFSREDAVNKAKAQFPTRLADVELAARAM